MSRRLPLGEGETARTPCVPGLLRTGVEEKTGDVLTAVVLARRVGWAADLVSGMAAELLAAHWHETDVDLLASGMDAEGRALPSNAWMALRRLGWSVAPPVGVRVNDRIVRMAQEQAGRTLRSAKWRADLTAGVIATWPADPRKRTPGEWDAVREAVPGGQAVVEPGTPTVRRDRSKTGTTRHGTTRPAPRRRRAPSATGPCGPAGKRPKGHAPTGRMRLPRAAHRYQGVTTISTPAPRRHKPRGAALGAGFHLHAHATPPRWPIPLPDTTSDMGSLN